MGARSQRRPRVDGANHEPHVMNSTHWYGIAFLGGAVIGFFVLNRVNNTLIDAVYTNGWTVAGGMGS